MKNASDSRLSSSVKSRTRRDSSEPRSSSTQTSASAASAAGASRCHTDTSSANTHQRTTSDALPPVELISLGIVISVFLALQCFHAVGWASVRASSPEKLLEV